MNLHCRQAASTGVDVGAAVLASSCRLKLGVLVVRTLPRPSQRAYVVACAAALTVLAGTSRVMLGVHWATDVVGGWAFGTAWATACLLVTTRDEAR